MLVTDGRVPMFYKEDMQTDTIHEAILLLQQRAEHSVAVAVEDGLGVTTERWVVYDNKENEKPIAYIRKTKDR